MSRNRDPFAGGTPDDDGSDGGSASRRDADDALTDEVSTWSDADFWAGPVTYASLQVLEQAIEGVGAPDRAAVTAYIKANSFKTVMGDWKFKNQVIENFWTVGQWQNGKFNGVSSTGKAGEKAVALKTGW